MCAPFRSDLPRSNPGTDPLRKLLIASSARALSLLIVLRHVTRDGGRWRAVAGLADALGSYALVSTLGVHPDDIPAGWNEETPTYQPPFPDTEEVTGETYGPLKVACEREAVRAFGDACLIIRPGYIVGPHDPTDRFTYYVRRAASGGEMLAPGPPDAPFQVVDVRDLAIFMLDRITARDSSVYGVVGPGEPIAMRDVLETGRNAADANTTFTWRPKPSWAVWATKSRSGSRCGSRARGPTTTTLARPGKPGFAIGSSATPSATRSRGIPIAVGLIFAGA
jgi:hypothetical protein